MISKDLLSLHDPAGDHEQLIARICECVTVKEAWRSIDSVMDLAWFAYVLRVPAMVIAQAACTVLKPIRSAFDATVGNLVDAIESANADQIIRASDDAYDRFTESPDDRAAAVYEACAWFGTLIDAARNGDSADAAGAAYMLARELSNVAKIYKLQWNTGELRERIEREYDGILGLLTMAELKC